MTHSTASPASAENTPHPRAAIGSIINALNRADYAADLSLAVHDVLPIPGETDIRESYQRAEDAGLPILPHFILTAKTVTMQSLRTFFTAALEDYPVDGVVLKAPSFRTRSRLGSTATAPNWAIAIKDYLLA